MSVGGVPMIVEIEMEGMQKFWIDKTIGGIIIEVPTGMDLRGTMDSRTGIRAIGIIVDSKAVTDSISTEIGARVRILIKGERRYGGRLNFLRVRVDQEDQLQNVRNPPISLSAICMTPVELLYVPFFLTETFTKSLWDIRAEKSFISEEVYKKYFFINQLEEDTSHGSDGTRCQMDS
ncbi:hypothetical protein TNCV_319091 [Trichonephila clavipes]|nr:hypothetical protein TNCV_319091 [Trichonephila clavipes]